MHPSARRRLLVALGILCAAFGVVAWFGLAWQALDDLDSISPHTGEGGKLMVWGLVGTVSMILGMILLQAAHE